jgi:hypothetical protein
MILQIYANDNKMKSGIRLSHFRKITVSQK